MMAAIDNFDIMEGENKMAILGDMLELGEQSEVEHQNIVRRLMESKIEKIILVGKEFEKACNQLGIRNEELGVNSQFYCQRLKDLRFSIFNQSLWQFDSHCVLVSV
jgi:UDP-N-acetylmuramoyl-tripeptide--D-alanyl-D-alanine ligase